MPDHYLSLAFDDTTYRRLAARAADLGQSLDDVARYNLSAWLGDWGQHAANHVVQPAETLRTIAERYYGDSSKDLVIAAFNSIANPLDIDVGQVLQIPEVGPAIPLPSGESPYLFGLHDRGGEHYMAWAGRRGWVLVTEALGCDSDDWSSRSYADLEAEGYGVMVRLNNGYGEVGTLPDSDRYDAFARRCGNFCGCSSGCHIWIIGNEPNLAVERPGGPINGEPITPERYARAFGRCRDEIRSRPGHQDDQIVVAAVGPWNIQTAYGGNSGGDWIVYFQDILDLLGPQVDGIALHTYGRDANSAEITSEARMDPPFHTRRKMFRSYIDFMEAIPADMRHLPVYITETDQNLTWDDSPNDWIQQAYAEIDRWNGDVSHQRIRAMVLYRWEKHSGDIWSIQDKQNVITDLRAALQHDYVWYK